MQHLTDRDLLALVAMRQLHALEVIYDRHIKLVWKLALISCDDAAAAERAVSGTFLELWRRPQPDATKRLVTRLLSGVRGRCAGRLEEQPAS